MTPKEAIVDQMPTNMTNEEKDRQARAVLGGLEMEGYVIVPREPTENMIDAGEDAASEHIITDTAVEVYRAMIGAA